MKWQNEKMVEHSILGAVDKSGLVLKQIDMLLSGDLLNQIISSSYAARAFDITYLGLFGACSTMAESLAIGATLVDGNYFKKCCLCNCKSFFNSRKTISFSTELGNQRPPTSQWTATAAGCSIVSLKGKRTCYNIGNIWQSNGLWHYRCK